MTTLSKLLRRTTAAALCAIAALTVPGVATAQTVSLSSGASCVYSAMTVNPNGNVTVTCGSVTSPGNLAIVGPASLATGTPYLTQIGVSRTGGSTGAASVDWTITTASTNGCVSSDGTNTFTTGQFSWADGESQTRIIPIQTGATSGLCVIALSNETGAAVGTASRTKTMNVVNGNDPVTFTLAAPTSATTVQGAGVSITVTRAGGPSNEWTVPVTLSGALTNTGALIVGGGTLSKTTLTFAAGSSSDSIVYTPPASAPATPALPSTFQLFLGTPLSPAGTIAGQTGSIVGSNTHTLTLGPAPVQGCGSTSGDVAIGWGATPTVALASGQIGSYVIPLTGTSRKVSGQWIVSTTTSGPADTYTGTFQVEAHISKCKGVITVPAGYDPCYAVGTSRAQPISGNLHHMFQLTATLNTPAAIAAAGACYTPASDGPWYINIRYTYAPGACLSTCGYKLTPYPWSY